MPSCCWGGVGGAHSDPGGVWSRFWRVALRSCLIGDSLWFSKEDGFSLREAGREQSYSPTPHPSLLASPSTLSCHFVWVCVFDSLSVVLAKKGGCDWSKVSVHQWWGGELTKHSIIVQINVENVKMVANKNEKIDFVLFLCWILEQNQV